MDKILSVPNLRTAVNTLRQVHTILVPIPRAAHTAEILLRDGPLVKRSFGPLGILRVSSIPTLQIRDHKDPMTHKVRTKHTQVALHKLIPLQDLTLTLIRLAVPIPRAEPMIPLAAFSICSLPKKKPWKNT